MEKNKRNTAILIILFAAVSILFLATRLYKLDSVPFGPHRMHIDEIGAAYDAFCISEYGVDQFLLRIPPYFRCFGEGQNALYTYLAAIVFKVGGISIFTFRLTAVICAYGALVALFFMIRDMIDKWYAIVAMCLMTVMPVFLMSEHWGLEAYLLMSFVIISMCFHIHAVITGKGLFFLLAGISWGVTYYTYTLSYIPVTVFLFLTMAVLLMYKKITWKNALLAGIPVLILGFPLLAEQLVYGGWVKPFSLFGIMDLWTPTHTRYGEVSPGFVAENLLGAFEYIYVADRSAYDANAQFGTMLYVSIPFILIGMISSAVAVIKSIKAKVLDPWLFAWMYFIITRIFLLFVRYPNCNRINGIYPAYLLFAVYGVKTAADFTKKAKPVFFVVLTAAYVISFIPFTRYMYSYEGLSNDAYSIGDSLGVDLQAGEAAALAKKIANGKPVIAMLNDGFMRHLSIALFTETSPYGFNRDHEPQDRSFNGVEWTMPDGLDLSGNTVYLIDNEIGHITSYLVSEEGFAVDITYPDFTVVYK